MTESERLEFVQLFTEIELAASEAEQRAGGDRVALHFERKELNRRVAEVLASVNADWRAMLACVLYWDVPEVSGHLLSEVMTGKRGAPPGTYGERHVGTYSCGHPAIVRSRAARDHFLSVSVGTRTVCDACRQERAARQERKRREREAPKVRDVAFTRDMARDLAWWVSEALGMHRDHNAEFLASVLAQGLKHEALTTAQWAAVCKVLAKLRALNTPPDDLADMPTAGNA